MDWDTFTNSKNELRALQVSCTPLLIHNLLFIQISLSVISLKVMEENVFKSLIRAMHVNMENLAADPIHEVHITNVPGGSGMHP